jgi:hypothetical protein
VAVYLIARGKLMLGGQIVTAAIMLRSSCSSLAAFLDNALDNWSDVDKCIEINASLNR